jgi:hypothetical protein
MNPNINLQQILEQHKQWLENFNKNFNKDKQADLRRADLSEADLHGADLSEADLRRADLRRADLIGADLSGADLSEADLSEADLRRADLSGADLSGADLRRADLSGAELSRADLIGADLRRAIFDFAGFPLSCGSFHAKADDRLILQFFAHITRFDTTNCSDQVKALVSSLPNLAKNGFIKYRNDVKPI